MREIKFRAWDKNESKFITGVLLNGDGEQYVITTRKLNISAAAVHGPMKVSNFVIQMYTGLTDHTGREIYEGDIVELDVKIHKIPKELNRHAVVFRKGAFVCSDNGFYFWDYAEGGSDDTVEVIGNIYENPELLEK